MLIRGNLIYFLIFIFLISACKPKVNRFNKLTITFDSTFNYDLINSPILFSEKFSSTQYCVFDSVSNKCIYKWDSLPPGDYSILIKTIFSKEQKNLFSLNKDTTFQVKNNLNFEFVEYIDSSILFKTDTLEIVYTSDGCFHSYYEGNILVKNKSDGYFSIYSKAGNRTDSINYRHFKDRISPEFLEDLMKVQIHSRKIKNEGLNGWSTTVQCLYVLVNNKLFYLNDRNPKVWNLYTDFREKYGFGKISENLPISSNDDEELMLKSSEELVDTINARYRE